jgi:hypothetical protein
MRRGYRHVLTIRPHLETTEPGRAVERNHRTTKPSVSGFGSILAGFVGFGIATLRARVDPRWAGLVTAIGSVAAIVMAPLVSVPSGPFRLDRVVVLAASCAFVWCGWYLLRHATLPGSTQGNDPAGTAIGRGPDHDR